MHRTRNPFTIGLLGCGLWGRRILGDLCALGARVHVVDVDASARAQALAAGAMTAVTTLDQADTCNGWVIATPASEHLASLRLLADAGVPLLCEKPLCIDAAQARGIETLGLADCHMLDVWRYHPAVEKLGTLASSGTLGTPLGLRSTRINWTSPRTDVDSLANLAPHDISIYREVFAGAWPEPASAFFEHDQDGNVRSAWMQWRGGPWMLSELGNRSPLRRRELRLHGEDAVAIWDAASPATLVIARGDADDQLEASERQNVPLDTSTALRRQLQAWLDWIGGDGPPPRSSLADGLRAFASIERMHELGKRA